MISGLLGLIALIFFVSYVAYHRFFSQLASIPGPFAASLSRWWLVKYTRKGDLHRRMIHLHDYYGPIVRTAPNEVSVSDPVAVKKIYGAGSKYHKAEWYGVLQGGRKFDLFAEQHVGIHAGQRRLVSRIYAMETLKDLEPYVHATVSRFIEKMQEHQGRSIDMGKWLQLFAFDVIGEVTFSQPFGFMDAQQDDGIFPRIQRSVECGVWLGHVPWFYRLHNFLMPLIGNHLAINDREGTIRNYTLREVQNRYERGSDRPDILGKLFTIHKERPQAMSMTDVTSVASSNVGAGSDTTAISLRAMLYYLLKHPEAKAKLTKEVDQFAESQGVSSVFDYQQAMKMPYLQAAMYEAMRLYPAIGMSLPRTTPPEGLMIGDKFIPGGTVVGANAWVIHRNKDIYGQDADEYRPERWIEKKNGEMQGYFFAFGMGARTCIGRNISWMEMTKLIPSLFLNFDMTLTNPDKALHEHCSFFVVQTGLDITLQPRKKRDLISEKV